MVNVAIVGSTGYGGIELVRFLMHHPKVKIGAVLSSSQAGDLLSESYPHLQGVFTGRLEEIDPVALKSKVDVVFTATPSGISTSLVPQLMEAGLRVIDLAGDFRIKKPEVYEKWYKHAAPPIEYLKKAVYGLSEAYADEIRHAQLLTNPGCYATAAQIALMPLLKSESIDPTSIIIDAKSGVSGAGRGLNMMVHYSETNENFQAYKVNRHQHIPEIEQSLSRVAGKDITVTFTTHLVPMTRGIMTTCYANVTTDANEEELRELYTEFYRGRRFVRIREAGKYPATKEVWGSNFCDLGISLDPRTKRITVISVIDNIVKGAAGQAIQNLNLMMGWDETTGLLYPPIYP
jgi:N-acetyl-gamma-glutamyl-phosphate reductase